MARTLARLARSCARHPWRTILVWVVVLVSLSSNASKLDGELVDDVRLPNSDAQEAADRLDASFSAQAGSSATIVFAVDDRGSDRHNRGPASLRDPAAVAAIRATLADIAGLDHVVGVSDPVDAGTIAADDRIGYAEVRYDRDTIDLDRDALTDLQDTLARLDASGVQAEVGGPLAAWEQAEESSSEQIGLLVAVVVLLIAFGSVIATLLPIGMALFALVVGETIIVMLAAATHIPTSASQLAAMIGLGVGIDYSLFIVTRFREARHRGTTVPDAAGEASGTAGAAVLFAGTSVVIAISGLLISGIWAVGMLGIAAAVVVAVSVVSALTLLPALLGLLGRWVDRLRIPGLGRAPHAGRAHAQARPGLSARWAHGVTRRPVAAAIAGTVVLLALAVPVLDMRLGQNDQGSQPPSTSQRKAYDLLADGFGPGFNGPLVLVGTVPDPAARQRIDDLRRAVADTRGVVAVSEPVFSPSGDMVVLNAMPATGPQDAQTTDVVHRLRDDVVPAATDGSDLDVLVGGNTAGFVDLDHQMSARLPILIGAVVGLAFVLLMIAFRSILVPLKAALMNLLSVSAAYGVVVAIFQWGWGKDVIGLAETIPIVSWVPMFLFAVLFGLSMDYEVFLLSRIREEYSDGGNTRDSVARGLASTARVITAAALIMIAVFLSFVAAPEPVTKMVGIGLAVAVLVDATIVRMLLVPSLMVLMGRANWWLPRWLDRLLPAVQLEDAGAGRTKTDRPPAPSPDDPVAPPAPPTQPSEPELVPSARR
jgi:putative drug exporter of the RND superfamily